jgi:hypothetical protein
VSSERGIFHGLWRLWGRELMDYNYFWSLKPGFWVIMCGEWTTIVLDLLVDS